MTFAELAYSLDTTVDDRLLQAEGLVRTYCGWHIAPSRVNVTVTVRTSDAYTALLPTLHLTGVTSVTDGTTVMDGDSYTFTAAGVLRRSTCWTGDPITVVFTHGYADPPPEVTAVVQSVAQRAVDNPRSLVSQQAGAFAVTYSQVGSSQSIPLSLLAAEKDVLDHYRIPSMP